LSKIYFDAIVVRPLPCEPDPIKGSDYIYNGMITSYYWQYDWSVLIHWYVPGDDGLSRNDCILKSDTCLYDL
jgi:hypothetical protein